MLKVKFDTTPLNDPNVVRGVGFYTKRLLANLKIQAPSYNIKIVESGDCDIVHYPYSDLFYPTLPLFKKTKTIVTIHDVIPLEFPERYPPGVKGLLNLISQRLALSTVERVITDSYASLKSIHKYFKIPHEKLKLVYLAADPIFRKKNNIKNKFNLPKKFVLYVGDVNYNKNIPGLVEACKLAKMPLVIVGRQAKQIENMDLSHPQLSHLKNLDLDSVLRLGFVSDEDLVDIYNLATVYCQASFAEGFGLCVLEALACGTPVACSNTHSLPEIAKDHATYFDPYNLDSVIAALKNPKVIKNYETEFSWEKAAKDTLMVYKEVYES